MIHTPSELHPPSAPRWILDKCNDGGPAFNRPRLSGHSAALGLDPLHSTIDILEGEGGTELHSGAIEGPCFTGFSDRHMPWNSLHHTCMPADADTASVLSISSCSLTGRTMLTHWEDDAHSLGRGCSLTGRTMLTHWEDNAEMSKARPQV